MTRLALKVTYRSNCLKRLDNSRPFNLLAPFMVLSAMLMTSFSMTASAAEIQSVTIRGDQESPRVLYLVPWKKIPAAKNNSDLELSLDYQYTPIRRSEVIREIRYFKQLKYTRKKDKPKAVSIK